MPMSSRSKSESDTEKLQRRNRELSILNIIAQAMNQEVDLTVTSALQTSAGRMIFGRLGDAGEKATEETPPRGRAQNPKPQPL